MDSTQVSCGTIFDISFVGQKYSELKDALENKNSIQLSAKELQKIDGAGIQLLVALFKEAEKMQVPISWNDTSAILINSARLLGVDTTLHLNV